MAISRFVSRSWRFLFPSPLRYHHSLSMSSQSQSFLCIETMSTWYLLDLFHPQNPYPVRSLPPPPIPVISSACTAAGHSLILVGGWPGLGPPSQDVQVFNARLNRWSIGSRMCSARWYSAAVGVINGKIYAFGGCSRDKPDSWAEVLDPQLGVWAPVPTPAHVREKGNFLSSAVLGGKLIAFSGQGLEVFDPEETIPEQAWSDMPVAMGSRLVAPAVVDEVLYSLDSTDRIKGYDPREGKWRQLEGWDKKFPNFKRIWMANVGGLLCVVWEEEGAESYETDVMIAAVKISRTSCGRLLGSMVLTESVAPAVIMKSTVFNCLPLEF